jgi:hypothetical protein
MGFLFNYTHNINPKYILKKGYRSTLATINNQKQKNQILLSLEWKS